MFFISLSNIQSDGLSVLTVTFYRSSFYERNSRIFDKRQVAFAKAKYNMNFKYLLRPIWTQLTASASDPFPLMFEFGKLSREQFGLNVASSIAIFDSKLLHVNRISESWHPHSSTTSEIFNFDILCHHNIQFDDSDCNHHPKIHYENEWAWRNFPYLTIEFEWELNST